MGRAAITRDQSHRETVSEIQLALTDPDLDLSTLVDKRNRLLNQHVELVCGVWATRNFQTRGEIELFEDSLVGLIACDDRLESVAK